MKYKIMLVAALLATVALKAQDKVKSSDLLGTWKVVAFTGTGEEMYGDVQKDSLVISDKMRKSWRNAEDSAFSMSMAKMMMEIMKELELGFSDKSVFTESMEGKSRKGTYKFDEATGILVTHTHVDDRLQVSMVNGMLKFQPLNKREGGSNFILFLKKK